MRTIVFVTDHWPWCICPRFLVKQFLCDTPRKNRKQHNWVEWLFEDSWITLNKGNLMDRNWEVSWLEALRKLEGEDNNLGLSIDSNNFVSSFKFKKREHSEKRSQSGKVERKPSLRVMKPYRTLSGQHLTLKEIVINRALSMTSFT